MLKKCFCINLECLPFENKAKGIVILFSGSHMSYKIDVFIKAHGYSTIVVMTWNGSFRYPYHGKLFCGSLRKNVIVLGE